MHDLPANILHFSPVLPNIQEVVPAFGRQMTQIKQAFATLQFRQANKE
ncbi:MAG: hypothetical protein JXO49_00470 [Deltaproteobacteria bacterium]|nr:hypothetical protein [Candidatus Anaeroferrophillus wilburensis]MBN2887798.1 hypothetical protein [Deltaproteobacteria bacterium]